MNDEVRDRFEIPKEMRSIAEASFGQTRKAFEKFLAKAEATAGSIEAAARRKQRAEQEEREAVERAQDNAALLSKTVLTIPQQAGDDGRLFGSVTTQDIADAIRDARGIRVDRRKIHLEEPIRHTGTYMVVVEVADGVTAAVKTMVVAAG